MTHSTLLKFTELWMVFGKTYVLTVWTGLSQHGHLKLLQPWPLIF